MKKRLIYSLFFSGTLLFICGACKSNVTNDTQKVTNAMYKIYDIKGERGYDVTFEATGNGAKPVAVVINRIRKEINPSDKKDNTYHINVIAETRKIHGYRPQGTSQENGVIYKINYTEYFKPVKFTLK
ncbi:hypothetical protein ELOC111193_10300 [Elizabethkingia occulta]|uniref:Lipoprotein n=1 Tax=Elizabethkingia occulta TaxID=1867263 RepID=A0A1T3MEZ7_9FLAO|nr:hypothetical protein [Elizabethkingia occulta]OPB91302.1 hypothetical protein BB020_11780 [Elizabethkingia occulta]OPC63056.1 hypothetical protein BAZ10_07800 [Elizabethkingia occulta]